MISDFTFVHGSWTIHNRRLLAPLTGSDEWEEFPAVSTCWGALDGAANTDEVRFTSKGTSGMTIRLLDSERGDWSIYWVSSRDGLMQPPVVGRFTDDSEFLAYGDDTHSGTPVRVRYHWSHITPTSARWEQAFSGDGERTWEINWIMELTRATFSR